MNTYEAVARPEEGGWDIEVPAADASHTWAPTLRKAHLYAREVVAGRFDVPLDEIDVTLTVELRRRTLGSSERPLRHPRGGLKPAWDDDDTDWATVYADVLTAP